jgi:hypothetical protein
MDTATLIVIAAFIGFADGVVGTSLAVIINSTLGSMRSERGMGSIGKVDVLTPEGARLFGLTIAAVALWPLLVVAILVTGHRSRDLFWNFTRYGKLSTTEAA